MSRKLPHHYAIAYLKAKGTEAQREAVNGCPPAWRELVRTHVRIFRSRGTVFSHEQKDRL
jgi:hypothetical protein